MPEIEAIIGELIAKAVRDAYERGVRDGRAETLDQAARKTAEFGSIGTWPSGRIKSATGGGNG